MTATPPPGADMNGWMDDIPASVTIEGLADSLVREAEAINQLVESSVWVRRGEPDEEGEWREVRRGEWTGATMVGSGQPSGVRARGTPGGGQSARWWSGWLRVPFRVRSRSLRARKVPR